MEIAAGSLKKYHSTMHTELWVWAKALLISALTFFSPIVPMIILVGCFIIADTVTGIWKAIKLGEEITSNKLSNVISKSLLYQGALLLAFGLDMVLLGGGGIIIATDYILSKVLLTAITFIEVKSIDENFEVITGTSLLSHVKQIVTRSIKFKNENGL